VGTKSLIKKTIAVLLAFFVIGCINPAPVWHTPDGYPDIKNDLLVEAQVRIGPGFSVTDRHAIIEGMNMWEYSTRGAFHWQLVDEIPEDDMVTLRAEFILVTSLEKRVNKYDEGSTLLGLAIINNLQPTQLWLVIDRLHTQADVKLVAAHEFGHALGIGHVSDALNVMSPHYRTATTCLTDEDMRAFCELYGCDYRQMVYCTRD
jgi:hypothetical protein